MSIGIQAYDTQYKKLRGRLQELQVMLQASHKKLLVTDRDKALQQVRDTQYYLGKLIKQLEQHLKIKQRRLSGSRRNRQSDYFQGNYGRIKGESKKLLKQAKDAKGQLDELEQIFLKGKAYRNISELMDELGSFSNKLEFREEVPGQAQRIDPADYIDLGAGLLGIATILAGIYAKWKKK